MNNHPSERGGAAPTTETTFKRGDIVEVRLTTDPEYDPHFYAPRMVEIHYTDQTGLSGFILSGDTTRRVSNGTPRLFPWAVIEQVIGTVPLQAVKGGDKQ